MPGSLLPRVKHYVAAGPSYLTPDQIKSSSQFIGKSTHLSYCLTGHLTLRVVPTQTVARPPTLSFTTYNDDGDDDSDDDDDGDDDDDDDDDDDSLMVQNDQVGVNQSQFATSAVTLNTLYHN